MSEIFSTPKSQLPTNSFSGASWSRQMAENDIFNRVPPQDIQAEISLLGSLLLDNDIIGEVVQICKPEDFYKTAHKIIFDALTELHHRLRSVDPVILADELRKR